MGQTDKDQKKNNPLLPRAFATKEGLPKATIVFFILMYLAVSFLVIHISRSTKMILVGDVQLPVSAFTGVFSTISNMCAVLMVVLYKKLGSVTAVIMLVLQIPSICLSVFAGHNATSIPGIFTNLFTIATVVIISVRNRQIEDYQLKVLNQAVTDHLTALPNRFAANELVKELVKQGRKFSVVLVDLNSFKSVNASMGEDTGNAVLVETAKRLKDAASATSPMIDMVARLGGDEFMLVIRNYDSDEELYKILRTCDMEIERKMALEGYEIYVSACFGYAEFPTDADQEDTLLACAGAAINEVKRMNSGDHILRFSPELLNEEQTLEMERLIRSALEHDTIFFYLQPQFDMSHKLRGFETLARMKDDDGKLVSPADFIPVAEAVGLIDQVDSAVFRKSAAFFGELIRKTHADIILSVNVSVRHMLKKGFLSELKEIIKEFDLPVSQLEIEITESVMIDSAGKALECIEEIKNMGIKIAIDDFGTGYSSLSYLYRFPADLLKVDKAFIDRMNSGESARQYVSSIISIGHIMGFDVICEGVEEQEQVDALGTIGCDYIQGFIWGKPLPQEEAKRLVETTT